MDNDKEWNYPIVRDNLVYASIQEVWILREKIKDLEGQK